MSKRIPKRRLATIALSVSLALGAALPAYAADAGAASPAVAVGSVALTGSSSFALKSIHVLPSASGKLATFTVTLRNGGSSELQFIDYWVRLKSKAGSQFSARLLPADKDKNRVAPGASMDITFYATVNDSTQLQDLVVQFIKWDFSQPNFERVLGEVAVPASYTDVAPAGGSALINVSGTDLSASIKKLVSNKNEKYYVPTVYLTLSNSGSHSVDLPAYLYAIRTKEGYLYPLEAKGAKDLTINPQESKDIQLSGSIPVSVSSDGWQLVITDTIADLKLNVPVGTFQLPAVTQESGGSIGKKYSFTSKSGVYNASLNGLYRLPWEDQDILTADLTLSNKGDESLPIPNLSGYFLLDGAVKVEAKLVQTAKVIGLGAGGSLNLQIAAKVPYTYEFSQIKLVLQEQESEAVTTDVLEFSGQSELQAIPFFSQGEAYTLPDTGRKTKYAVRRTATYPGKTSSVFVAQVEATNLEKRQTNLTHLVAHFRTADGSVFPASIAEVTSKISPSGQALLQVSAMLPKGLATDNMHLLLGEAVTDGKLTSGDSKADSYVKPVAFWLPQDTTAVKDKLLGVSIFPYTLSINRIGTSIDPSALTLKFNYELTRDSQMEVNNDGHKLVLVFEDGAGTKTFEKSYDYKDFDAANDENGDDGTKLRVGKHEEFKIAMNDADMIFKLQYLKNYTLSLYDEFQGQRKLLASQKLDWFITSD
ncbi:hypothetical protein B5M42_022910 [Paenibacillus athensensis]|uniref:Uncharacterized protein n=1 Tax=Paenibacillus athensensis TaxID=1967502 RepID=A0A4Y8PQX8_9BACL|nr:hypothetical protein [Paenibacillus athensensis]MCD1261659.1 hypothetical protein [Paenibacillus athensensis]